MVVTFLGTGTSQGVPVIGCDCDTCLSNNPLDKRLRSSVWIQEKGVDIIIDAGPDFRQQMLKNHVKKVDALFITHEHNDHIAGLDDIRPFNFNQNKVMPLYALQRVVNSIKNRFDYIFFEKNKYPGSPRIECLPIDDVKEIVVEKKEKIIPIPVMHGPLPIVGYRIGGFGYITDASVIHASSLKRLENLDVLVLNALQYRTHHSHFNFDQAVEMAQIINAKQTYFTHLSHTLGRHEDIVSRCPSHILPAYDGLQIDI